MIICIGDSITYGQLLADPVAAWPYRISNYRVLSRGVPGDTTRLGLERFPRDVQQNAPSIVIIQFGHNDANRWKTDRGLHRVSPAAFKVNLIEMVDRARKFDAEPMLCSLTPTFRNAGFAEDVAHYDQIIRRVADDENVRLIDVRAAFGTGDGLLLADGLHLSERGHEVYADTAQKALDAAARG
jgi:lysophospholipase L1-like esterase